MVSNIKTVFYKEMIEASRIDPKYFFLEDKINKYRNNKNFSLVELGDKNLVKNITDGEHAGQIFIEEGVLFIKNSSVKDYDISILDGFYISEEKHQKLKRSALKSEDILFTTIGHLGSSTIVPENFGEANINQNLVKIEIDKDFLDPYYLASFLNSSFIKEQINCLFTGNIHSILTYPKIKKLSIIKPSNLIQKRIREKYRKAIDFEKKANEIILEAKDEFRRYLNLDLERIKSKNFYSIRISELKNNILIPNLYSPESSLIKEDISKKWKTEKLGGEGGLSIVKNGDEVGSDNYNLYLEKQNADIPFVRTSDIYNFQVDLSPDYYIPQEISTILNQELKDGDILFTKDGHIGKVAFVTKEDKFIAASGLAIIRASKINPYYLFLTLISQEVGQLQANQNTVVASTLPHLREDKIEDFDIPLLPKDKINKLSSKIEKAFEFKDKKKELISSIKEEIENIINF